MHSTLGATLLGEMPIVNLFDDASHRLSWIIGTLFGINGRKAVFRIQRG